MGNTSFIYLFIYYYSIYNVDLDWRTWEKGFPMPLHHRLFCLAVRLLDEFLLFLEKVSRKDFKFSKQPISFNKLIKLKKSWKSTIPRGTFSPLARTSLIGTGSCCIVLTAWLNVPFSCSGTACSLTEGVSSIPSIYSSFSRKGPSTDNLVDKITLLSICSCQ